MGYEAWFALSVVVVMLGFLALTKIGPDTVLMGGVTLLLITGVLSPSEALSGLANEGMVTVGVLYIVAAGIDRTGLTVVIVDYLLGKPRSMLTAQLRLQVPTTVISAFTNNTPQVAIMIPAVEQWCRRHDLPVSKFMIPLSYASLLGMWTLIGTSTNLIVNGLMMSQAKAPSLGMFDIAWVGVPVSILGLAFMISTQQMAASRSSAGNQLHREHAGIHGRNDCGAGRQARGQNRRGGGSAKFA